MRAARARGPRRLTAARAIAATGVCAALVCAPARAQQVASISAGFSPLRLGAHSALRLGFQIGTRDGSLPSALTGLDFHFPSNLGIGVSGLGVASCPAARLEAEGPKACPANSIMGTGQALAKFQVSPEISEESAGLALVAGASPSGYIKMLVSATGVTPVNTRILMSSLLLPGQLRFQVPLVPTVPEGPDVAVTDVRVTLGGNLTYYERVHGRRVAYRPQGILLPRRCPRGGFRFSAVFSFLDGTQAQARTVVRCPR
ncbi:MAG TPA: hypothetical protein VMS02_02095 [Solirubrobacteraceae bacterium]|nr:hypothetical protein [Solirubrobacteraceae bacterium]